MGTIKDIEAREILDSRGNPTIEAEIILESGVRGHASVPSGASTGAREALELRDGGTRYGGKGVLNAIRNIRTEIRAALVGHDVRHQKGIDDLLVNLDDTTNKGRLGANALLAVSLAAARTAATSTRTPLYQYISLQQRITPSILPVPLLNLINGGAHADNNLEFQEFMVIPVGAPNFKEAIRFGAEIFHALKALLKREGFNTNVADEGGFAPDFKNNEEAIEMLLRAIDETGLKPKKDVYLGLDLAASQFFQAGKYVLASENRSFEPREFVEYLSKWVELYPIISIEDGMAEEDWEGWGLLTERLGSQCQLVGDDLFVTNTKIFIQGVQEKIANAILIKPNQIGTLTETLAAIEMAKDSNYASVISHRSGETIDNFIADLCVGTGVMQIKAGSVSRGERLAKYNELIRIEDFLGKTAQYAGKRAFQGKAT